MKCHSTGCHVWPLTAGLYIFFSTLCICYRNQMAKNNTLKNEIYSFWLHKNCTVCPSSISFCNNSILKVHIQTLFPACTTKISFSNFSLSRLCSALLFELKYFCDWKSISLWYSKIQRDKTNLSQSSLDCPAALLHAEIGKVTLMRETQTVNHWLLGLFTHSLKGSPFKFDQYQSKSSQRVTQRSGY